MAGTWPRNAPAATASTASTTAFPPSLRWDRERFVATLKFYQAGERTNPVMVSVAKSLDADQLAALAAYYGSLPKPAAKAKKYQ